MKKSELSNDLEMGQETLEQLFTAINQKLIEHDERFEQVGFKLSEHDERFNWINNKLSEHDERFGEIDQRFDNIDQRFDKLDNVLATLLAMLKNYEEERKEVKAALWEHDRRILKLESN